VEEDDDHARFADIEILRDVHENPVYRCRSRLPKNLAPQAAMAAAVATRNVEERLVGARIVAEIGKMPRISS